MLSACLIHSLNPEELSPALKLLLLLMVHELPLPLRAKSGTSRSQTADLDQSSFLRIVLAIWLFWQACSQERSMIGSCCGIRPKRSSAMVGHSSSSST